MSDLIRTLRKTLPRAGNIAWRKTNRRLLRLRLDLTGADEAERIRAERCQRGREQYASLQKADAVIVSFAKSGRTWLRVMVSRLYQQVYDLPDDTMIGFDNFHNMDVRIPRVFFTHDNYISDYTGNVDNKVDYYDKKVLLLVRDPRDVAVSHFFQWRFRMGAKNKFLNPYLPKSEDCCVRDFVMRKDAGLQKIIGFMNLWAREMHHVHSLLLLRYEDMRADPVEALAQVAQFLDVPASAAQISEAVRYASYENMKKKEAEQSFRMSGGRMTPGDPNNPDSFKVRRGKVGGYTDYFENEELETVDKMVTETLDNVFGYTDKGVSPSHNK